MTILEQIAAIHPDALVLWDKAMQETGFEIPESVRLVPINMGATLPYTVVGTSERFVAAWCGKRWVIRKITDWEKFAIPCSAGLASYGAEDFDDFMKRVDDACVEAGFPRRWDSTSVQPS